MGWEIVLSGCVLLDKCIIMWGDKLPTPFSVQKKITYNSLKQNYTTISSQNVSPCFIYFLYFHSRVQCLYISAAFIDIKS